MGFCFFQLNLYASAGEQGVSTQTRLTIEDCRIVLRSLKNASEKNPKIKQELAALIVLQRLREARQDADEAELNDSQNIEYEKQARTILQDLLAETAQSKKEE